MSNLDLETKKRHVNRRQAVPEREGGHLEGYGKANIIKALYVYETVMIKHGIL